MQRCGEALTEAMKCGGGGGGASAAQPTDSTDATATATYAQAAEAYGSGGDGAAAAARPRGIVSSVVGRSSAQHEMLACMAEHVRCLAATAHVPGTYAVESECPSEASAAVAAETFEDIETDSCGPAGVTRTAGGARGEGSQQSPSSRANSDMDADVSEVTVCGDGSQVAAAAAAAALPARQAYGMKALSACVHGGQVHGGDAASDVLPVLPDQLLRPWQRLWPVMPL